MSNWIINIENMILINIGRMQVNKIKYNKEENAIYCYWEDGKWNGWELCIDKIRDLYLKEING